MKLDLNQCLLELTSKIHWIDARNGKYDLDFKNPASDPATYLESAKLAELYQEFIKEFPMVSIEDPFDQDDWAAWTSLTANTPIQVKK